MYVDYKKRSKVVFLYKYCEMHEGLSLQMKTSKNNSDGWPDIFGSAGKRAFHFCPTFDLERISHTSFHSHPVLSWEVKLGERSEWTGDGKPHTSFHTTQPRVSKWINKWLARQWHIHILNCLCIFHLVKVPIWILIWTSGEDNAQIGWVNR